jgi:hypothetical protein
MLSNLMDYWRNQMLKGRLKIPILILLFLTQVSLDNSYAGLFSADSKPGVQANPCEDEAFVKSYGQYCSGWFTKTIRCFSDGGVCSSPEVCNPLDSTVKKLCETYCLNTSTEKMGHQTIRVSCIPSPGVRGLRNNAEEGSEGDALQIEPQPQEENDSSNNQFSTLETAEKSSATVVSVGVEYLSENPFWFGTSD